VNRHDSDREGEHIARIELLTKHKVGQQRKSSHAAFIEVRERMELQFQLGPNWIYDTKKDGFPENCQE